MWTVLSRPDPCPCLPITPSRPTSATGVQYEPADASQPLGLYTNANQCSYCRFSVDHVRYYIMDVAELSRPALRTGYDKAKLFVYIR